MKVLSPQYMGYNLKMKVWGLHGSQDNQSLYITVLREKPKRRRFCFAIAPVAERQNGYRQNSIVAILVFSKRAAQRTNAETPKG